MFSLFSSALFHNFLFAKWCPHLSLWASLFSSLYQINPKKKKKWISSECIFQTLSWWVYLAFNFFMCFGILVYRLIMAGSFCFSFMLCISLPSFLSGGFSFVVASIRRVQDWSCDGSHEFVLFTDLGSCMYGLMGWLDPILGCEAVFALLLPQACSFGHSS